LQSWFERKKNCSEMRGLKISIVALLCSLMLGSCSIFRKSAVDKAEVSEKQEINAFDAEIRKRQKAHYKMQTREAKKMMKRSMKKSKKLNRPRLQDG
jgi:hypothetical protein